MQDRNPWITVPTAAGPMQTYVARPAAPATRAVIVLQEAFGVNAHIQDIAQRFAAQGFLALAPDLFHRSGTRELAYAQHSEAVALISQIGVAPILEDVQAVLAHLQSAEQIGAGRTAVVGFCFGGRAAFTAATRLPDLGAGVVFYGPGIAAGPHATLGDAGAIRAPLLLHVGAEDPTIPPAQVQAIDGALQAAGVRFAQHVYPGAGHAFLCDARPAMYREGAAAQAWGRTLDFLNTELPPGQ